MRTLIVMAKAPQAGAAKTRLAAAADIGFEGAARIADGLLRDTLETAREWVEEGDTDEQALLLAFTPVTERAWFAELAPDARLVEQAGEDLTERLQVVTRDAFARGASSVVVVGTDAPELSAEDVERAFEALASRDVVLGPCVDGGYWLVGLARDLPALFESIPWSTAAVHARTLARARELGLSVGELDLHFDVDEPADLERVKCWLATVAPSRARHVRAVLAG